MSPQISILIATKNRCDSLKQLLASLAALSQLDRLCAEVVVADNASTDATGELLIEASRQFAVSLKILKVSRAGKSAALNEAIAAAGGEILAFLDDDVVVAESWIETLARHFLDHPEYAVAQGVVRIPAPESEDPEIQQLLKRYRTIPNLDLHAGHREVRLLNGSNFAARRALFDHIRGFDERLGPGASGTSEDVELAQRILKAGYKIAYMRDVVVYHRVDRARLTEEYFKLSHTRQGRSRLLMTNSGTARILANLCRAALQYACCCVAGNERDKYRGKGRVFHYLAMLEGKCRRPSSTAVRDGPDPLT